MASSASVPEETNSVPLEGITVEPGRLGSFKRKIKEQEHGVRELIKQRAVLRRLRASYNWDQRRRQSLTRFCLSKVGLSRRPAYPDEDELESLVTYHFQPRAQLKGIVCDFGDGRFERSECDMSTFDNGICADLSQNATAISRVMKFRGQSQNGPLCVGCEVQSSIVVVTCTDRPSHIPIGQGLLAYVSKLARLESILGTRLSFHELMRSRWLQTLQNRFINSAPKRLERQNPQHSQCEVLCLRSFQHLRDQTDILNILSPFKNGFLRLRVILDELNWRGMEGTPIHADLESRCNFFGKAAMGFWEDARSDLPSLLTEGGYGDPHFSTIPQLPRINDQMLSQHWSYKRTILVRDVLHSFVREDGFLLTMSPMIGINYLDGESSSTLKESALSPQNALENLRQLWTGNRPFHPGAGTQSWEDQSVDWLLTSIITELQGTPHNRKSLGPFPDLQTAYSWVVRNLRKRQTLPLKRYESVELVREYANCMNEISCIHDISEQKIRRLEGLRKQWLDFDGRLWEAESNVTIRKDCPKLSQTIEERIELIKADHEYLPRLLNDLKGSLNVLFQTRTMEQNELTLMAESNSRAILVFTIVTIIFLPLSFFTSYFGMNIKGIADTDRTERYFWAVCGSVTTFVVGLTIIFGFKDRIRAWILSSTSED